MSNYARDSTIFLFHDAWLRGVSRAVAHARQEGLHNLWLPTSAEMVVGTRDTAVFNRLRQAFPEGIEDRKPRNHTLTYLRHLASVANYHRERLLGIY